jgi:hypothetical protein
MWLDDLLALARIAEGLPAPRVTAEESGAEQAEWPIPLAFILGANRISIRG